MRRLFLKLLLLFIIATCLSSCGNIIKGSSDDMLKRHCEKYAKEYEIKETGENGAVQVRISAPDYGKIIKHLSDEKEVEKITIRDIENATKETPEYTKDYTIWADNEDDETIRKAFLEEVSRELIVNAITNKEFKEEWSAEQ